MNSANIKIVERTCKIIFACTAALFLCAGLIIHLRLDHIHAKKVHLEAVSETCSSASCSAQFNFKAEKRFILLGQILRSFDLLEASSKKEILPVSAMTGTNSDSWLRLKVYELTPGSVYEIHAKKPASAKLNYFSGILPRETDDEGILPIPQLGMTISHLAVSVTLGVMLLLICASLITASSRLTMNPSRKSSHIAITTAAILLTCAASISSGLLDTIFPDGEFRNRSLRSLFAATAIILVVKTPKIIDMARSRFVFFAYALALLMVTFLAWPVLRDAKYYSLTLVILSLAGAYRFAREKEYVAAVLWASGLIDAGRTLGIASIADYPPLYVLNQFPLIAFGIFAGHSGGFATIAVAGESYRRFKRDLVLESIKNTIKSSKDRDSSTIIYEIRSLLGPISDLLHAGRISLTINLPLGRPIVQVYDRETDSSQIFDDGTIPGAVTMRTLLYGDTVMFESFEDYAKRLNIPTTKSLQSAHYFCAMPIRVNHNIVGSLMLTKFSDEKVRQKMASGDFLATEMENIISVISAFEQSLSAIIAQDLSNSSKTSKALHKTLHEEIALCDKPADFLSVFANSIASHCKTQVIIHTKIANQGIAVANSGLSPDAWSFFCKNPLNLDPDSASSVGPTIVAFMEKRSSFIKDIHEISHKLHPKTQSVFELMDAESIAAVPLYSEDRIFVATLIRTRGSGVADAGIVQVVESTEALFIAAIEIMSQRSSVVALGELTSRLIGDADIRKKIIEAAKARNLPTTIGSPKTSFLLLFDLAGSSDLSQDTELKARAYGHFYDSVNRKAQELLNGTIRKTIGDAVIITWDGSGRDPSLDSQFLNNLRIVTKFADGVARSIGCKGARALLHHGKYFLGLVGTETFGQIDVIGSGIDEVCKLEGHMKHISIDGSPVKLAISNGAAEKLANNDSAEFLRENLTVFHDITSGPSIQYACTLSLNSKGNSNVA